MKARDLRQRVNARKRNARDLAARAPAKKHVSVVEEPAEAPLPATVEAWIEHARVMSRRMPMAPPHEARAAEDAGIAAMLAALTGHER